MADTHITDLSTLTTAATGDKIPVVDVSDTTQALTGSTKYITLANFKTSQAFTAADIAAGTFPAGTFVFPNGVNVGDNLSVTGTVTGTAVEVGDTAGAVHGLECATTAANGTAGSPKEWAVATARYGADTPFTGAGLYAVNSFTSDQNMILRLKVRNGPDTYQTALTLNADKSAAVAGGLTVAGSTAINALTATTGTFSGNVTVNGTLDPAGGLVGLGTLQSITLDNGSSIGRVIFTKFTVANGATKVVATSVGSTSLGWVDLFVSGSRGAARIGLSGTTTTLEFGNASIFGLAMNALEQNIYVTSGNLTIQNLSGSTQSYIAAVYGAI